jgi:hypothetical protein
MGGVLVVLVGVLGACNGGGGASASRDAGPDGDPRAVCTLMRRLAETGDAVARANVQDPATFGKTLERAVERYARIASDLQRVVPEDLRDEVERLEAAVTQYRFGDAVDDHAALDAYAQREC